MGRFIFLILLGMSAAFALEGNVSQLIVSIAPTWDSPEGKLQCFQRTGKTWSAVGEPVRVLYGKNGLAWGRGEFGIGETGLTKREGDKRAPAGVFKLGRIYTYDPALPAGADYPFHPITENDAWVDDVNNPFYNQHVEVDLKNPPPWFEKQKMRLNDPPHRWLIEIRHNADPPVAGAGSAIFFHIQRGPNRYSAGCTVMPEAAIVKIICWLRASANPRYVLLPAAEYQRRWKDWGLPAPKEVADLLGTNLPGGP